MLMNKSKGFEMFLKKSVLVVLVCMLFTSCATLSMPNKYKQDIDIEVCIYARPDLDVSTIAVNTDVIKKVAREYAKELDYNSWCIIENVTIDFCYLQPVEFDIDGHIISKYIILYKGYSNNVTIGSMIHDSESNKITTDKSVISSAQQLLELSKKDREIKLTTRYESYRKLLDEQYGN